MTLPAVDPKTGEPGIGVLRTHLVRTPVWLWPLFALGLVGVVVGLWASDRTYMDLPISKASRRRRRVSLWTQALAALGGVALYLASSWFSVAVVTVVVIAALERAAWVGVRLTKSDTCVIQGVHQGFIDAVHVSSEVADS